MRKVFKITWFIVRSVLIFIFGGAFMTSTVKNIEYRAYINDFKSKGVYQEDISSSNTKYYLVSAVDEAPSYIKSSSGSIYPGNTGDILITRKGSFGDNILNECIEWFAGGHAAIVTGEYKDYNTNSSIYSSVEATGMDPSNPDSTVGSRHYWGTGNFYTEILGLRVKMTDEEKDRVISNAISLVGEPYNYSFIFSTDKYSYCSDLVSKAYSSIGKNLNKDGFTTSVYDLLVSNDTYVSYYQYVDSENVKHIYYFG